MNQNAPAGDSTPVIAIGSYGTITVIHLVLVGLFALAVIAAIVYGARLKRRRVAASDRMEEHAAEAGVAEAPAPAPEPTLPADTPRAPAPAERTAAPSRDMDEEPAAPPVADEPIAAASPLTASPATEAASAPPADPDAGPAAGPVTQLKGLGPKVAARLADLGVTTVGQVAALDSNAAERLDAELGAFRGRMERDRWIEQARFLAAGDRAGFEAVFGKL